MNELGGNSLEFEIPSWNKIYDLILKLGENIKNSGFKPEIVVGVSRGGWIPARILSDILEVPKLANVSLEFYVGVNKTKKEPQITQDVSLPVKDYKILIVDDLVDSGKTSKLVTSYLKKLGSREIKTASIYYKPWSIIVPDYYQKRTKCWVVFPWERKEMIPAILKRLSQDLTLSAAKEKLINSGLNRKIIEYFTTDDLKEKQ